MSVLDIFHENRMVLRLLKKKKTFVDWLIIIIPAIKCLVKMFLKKPYVFLNYLNENSEIV